MEHWLPKRCIRKDKIERADQKSNIQIPKSRKTKEFGNADIAEVDNADLACDAKVNGKRNYSAQDIDDCAAAAGEKWLLVCSLSNGYVFGHGLF